MLEQDKKECTVQIRLKKDEKEQLLKKASSAGLSITDYIRVKCGIVNEKLPE